MPPFSDQFHLEEVDTHESYEVTFKPDRQTSINLLYDVNMKFIQVQIPPIKWLVVDAKSLRPSTSRSRDIDFRMVISSERHWPAARVATSGEYEKFKTKKVILGSCGYNDYLLWFLVKIILHGVFCFLFFVFCFLFFLFR